MPTVGRWRGSWLAMLAVSAGAAAAPSAVAQTADAGVAFDIPAQTLDAALARYSAVTGVQLLYDASLAAGRRSAAVRGAFSPREALRRLLERTGLAVRYSRGNAATLVAAGSAVDDGVIALGRVVVQDRIAPARLSAWDRLAYYRRIEDELHGHVSADPRLDRAAFRIVVSLGIDARGRIAELRVVRGSGSRDTDAAVVRTLDGTVVSPPPVGLVQPLAIVLTGRRGRER